jgi:hypothetical protein
MLRAHARGLLCDRVQLESDHTIMKFERIGIVADRGQAAQRQPDKRQQAPHNCDTDVEHLYRRLSNPAQKCEPDA